MPTPVKKNTKPDLSNIRNAFAEIYKKIKKGQLIILESTTYPGTTRDIIAKKISSKFHIGNDYFVSYSPERENPGGNMPYANITKICAGFSNKCLTLSRNLYLQVVKKVVPAKSLEEGEMVKLLENVYRSVNIGLVNELKIISKSMKLDINNVIKLASTKPFGFQSFYPGPGVGGHCIPIDPYYLYWRAKQFNKNARFINLAAKVNEETTKWVINQIFTILKKYKINFKRAKVLVLGLAYKKKYRGYKRVCWFKNSKGFVKKEYSSKLF